VQKISLAAAANLVSGFHELFHMFTVGRNPRLLNKIFSNIPRGEGIKMSFEEFRQTLLTGGLGMDVKETQAFFLALGGSSGYADMDTLWDFLSELSSTGSSLDLGRVEEPAKITKFGSSVTNADFRLREIMRKGYKELKHAIDVADSGRTGYIDAIKLHGTFSLHYYHRLVIFILCRLLK
jgi:hypothetical protein